MSKSNTQRFESRSKSPARGSRLYSRPPDGFRWTAPPRPRYTRLMKRTALIALSLLGLSAGAAYAAAPEAVAGAVDACCKLVMACCG